MEKQLPPVLVRLQSLNYIRAAFLADFLKLPQSSMNKVKNIFIKTLALTAFAFATQANAQWGEGWGGAEEGSTDTAAVDTTASSGGGDFGWGASESSGPQAPKRAVYKRFIPPYDSLREIIYYEGVIEDENCEFCGADSLYWRARKYLVQRYGKENYKKFVVEDKKADRITLKVTVPMIIRYGQYNKSEVGMMEYKLTLRFKDFRYKYQFGNFVHIQTPGGVTKESTKTYHEYYMRVKKGYQTTDKYLLSADYEVKELVEGLKKSLREPYQPDEDDW